MNVFLITSVPLVPPWDQGAKNLAYALTCALSQHRFRVLIARDEPLPSGENLDLEPVYRSTCPSLIQKARVYWWLLSRPVSRFASSDTWHRPDLYHLIYQPYPLSSWLARLLPEFRRGPTLHTVPAAASLRPAVRDLFFADRVVAISEHGRQVLQQLGLENVAYIPPGIEVARWQTLHGQADRLKTRLELAGHPVVLFPGHYGPGQGAEVMFGALPRLVAQVPEVRVVFACRLRSPHDQERERSIRDAVNRQGLAEIVRFYSAVADMETLIGASDLVVLPLETMRDKLDIPTTLLESLAAGKPIVISDLPPMSELVVGAKSHSACQDEVGLAVPLGDSEALALAVAALLTDPGLREHMGRRGQALVRNRFDIQQVARQYETLYREMVR